MVEVDICNRLTGEELIIWGWSVEGAMRKGGYTPSEWEVLRWEFID